MKQSFAIFTGHVPDGFVGLDCGIPIHRARHRRTVEQRIIGIIKQASMIMN